ncbi:hypothetical protein AGLY_004730 [Aphis glycines]|uniref:Uncharacterized protein n=1 Tax=Aphis glycines TaxID=307491 RepID=A0A6G0TUQ9_APHGL|nr:hypothetical protein AGLY_004730 [Aphis glycines]
MKKGTTIDNLTLASSVLSITYLILFNKILNERLLYIALKYKRPQSFYTRRLHANEYLTSTSCKPGNFFFNTSTDRTVALVLFKLNGNLINVLAQVSVTLVKAKSTDSKLPKGPQSNIEFRSKSVPRAGSDKFCGPPFLYQQSDFFDASLPRPSTQALSTKHPSRFCCFLTLPKRTYPNVWLSIESRQLNFRRTQLQSVNTNRTSRLLSRGQLILAYEFHNLHAILFLISQRKSMRETAADATVEQNNNVASQVIGVIAIEFGFRTISRQLL